MFYNIISTGSKGNALVIEDNILIDCGVSFTKLKNVYKKFINCITDTYTY